MKQSKLKQRLKRLLACFIGAVLLASAISCHKSDAVIKSKIVRLKNKQGMCSGEQVKAPSGANYILTAAHCRLLDGNTGSIHVITEDGRQLERKIIAEDPNSDLLLLEGLPETDGLAIGEVTHRGQSVRTFTHGKDLDTYITGGELIQYLQVDVPLSVIETPEDEAKCNLPKLAVKDMATFFGPIKMCMLSVTETVSTAFITHGSSGGAVMNSSGELVGVVSAGNGEFGLFVTLKDIKAFLSNY